MNDYEKQEAYYVQLDSRIEEHLEYVLNDGEMLGETLKTEMLKNPCIKTILKNLIRDNIRETVLVDLNLI